MLKLIPSLCSQSLISRISLAEHLVSKNIFLYPKTEYQTSSSTNTAMLNKGKLKILLYYLYNKVFSMFMHFLKSYESRTSTKNIGSNNLIHNGTQTNLVFSRFFQYRRILNLKIAIRIQRKR